MAVAGTTFESAARSFAGLVRRIPDDAWDGPGLGDWDLRSLVGHASRSLITVSTYLQTSAEREDVATPQDYYAWIGRLHVDRRSRGHRRTRQAGGPRPRRRPRRRRRRTRRAGHWASWKPRATRSSRSSAASASGCTPICRPGSSSWPCTAWISHGRPGFRSNCPPMCWTRPPYWQPGSASQTGRGDTLLMSLTGRETLPPASRSYDAMSSCRMRWSIVIDHPQPRRSPWQSKFSPQCCPT